LYSEAFKHLTQTVKRTAAMLAQPKGPVSVNRTVQVLVGVSGRHGAEHLVVHFEAAVDSRLLLGQFMFVLNYLIVLPNACVMTWYVSHLPKLPS